MMGLGNLNAMVFTVTTWALPIIFAVTLHEAAHGYVALRSGDDTALRAGRVSLNPLNHVDPMGTIVLPLLLLASQTGFLFGYAKPVPVNFGRLRQPRRDMVFVALAGPGMNVLLAIVSALLFYGVDLIPGVTAEWVARNLVNSMSINVVLCVFNLLPLPPLDGGRVAVGVLPNVLARPLARLEPYGMMILISLFLLSYVLVRIGSGIDLLEWLVGVPSSMLYRFVLFITGH
ncbi:MAG: site-2 protease family protein [Stellaceae bacterium]